MVDSSRRRASRDVMSNHNRCWIWGRNVVIETVKAGYWPILELVLSDSIDPKLAAQTIRLAERTGTLTRAVDDAELEKLCRTTEHQGFAARMTAFPYRQPDELLRTLSKNAAVAVLDRLQDPFNFGAIVRSASALGIDGIVIGDREQSDVNSQVVRSSAGAVNHVPLARAVDLPAAVDTWKKQGFQIVAASEKGNCSLFEAELSRRTMIVIGNEGAGIRPELLSRCDVSVSIPMSGPVGSLNAAVAAGILFYELRRQRCRPDGKAM